MATHHPFTMPYPEDLQYLFTDPGRVRAQAFDVVLNGVELGSGSVRIHQREVQKQMFEALGFDDEQIEARFGFMVNAYRLRRASPCRLCLRSGPVRDGADRRREPAGRAWPSPN